jgi:hypothetical protein
MRLTLTLLFALFSLNALALISDRSIELSRVLSENKVLPSGKRQYQGARAYCDDSARRKSQGIECTIIVEGPGQFPNSVYEVLRGNKAQELSELLTQFNIHPVGKRKVQNADITCRLPKKQLQAPTECKVIDLDRFSGL